MPRPPRSRDVLHPPTGSAAGRLAYRNREISLDLWPAATAGADEPLRAELRHRVAGPMAAVPALLVQGNEVRARTVSDERGRFRLALPGGEPFELWLVLSADEVLRLELDPGDARLGGRRPSTELN